MASGTRLHRTYYEGDDDASVLRVLASAGFLPPDLDVVKKEHRKNSGKDGMVKDLAPFVDPAGGAGRSAVAIRDVDELTSVQIRDWFLDQMKVHLTTATPPVEVLPQGTAAHVLHFQLQAPGLPHVGRVVVVPVGLSAGPAATAYGITQFAMDDYVLLLASEQAVYESVSEFEDVPHALAMKKLGEVAALMRKNGIPIKHTKRLMHVLRAVTGFRAAPATCAERIVSKALDVLGTARIREIFSPLIQALEEASRLLGMSN
jgi:hypothetical protein